MADLTLDEIIAYTALVIEERRWVAETVRQNRAVVAAGATNDALETYEPWLAALDAQILQSVKLQGGLLTIPTDGREVGLVYAPKGALVVYRKRETDTHLWPRVLEVLRCVDGKIGEHVTSDGRSYYICGPKSGLAGRIDVKRGLAHSILARLGRLPANGELDGLDAMGANERAAFLALRRERHEADITAMLVRIEKWLNGRSAHNWLLDGGLVSCVACGAKKTSKLAAARCKLNSATHADDAGKFLNSVLVGGYSRQGVQKRARDEKKRAATNT